MPSSAIPSSGCQGVWQAVCRGAGSCALCGISVPCEWGGVGPPAVFLVSWRFALWGCCSCWKTLPRLCLPCVGGDSQTWTAKLKAVCKITQQSSLGWTPQWRVGACGVGGEAGTVSSCSWNSLWGFCSALTGEYQATVVAWGLSNCSHPSTAVPGSSLHSWRQGCCWGLWALTQPPCAGRALVQPWTSAPTGLVLGPNLLCTAGTLWVAAAEIAEHILKWKQHLDKLTPLEVLYFTLTLLWDHESHFRFVLLMW